MAKFNHCFIYENGTYLEIPYSKLFNGKTRNPEFAGRYFLPFDNCLMEVTHEDYLKEYKEKRRQKYIREESVLHDEVSYHALDTDDLNGEETIKDMTTDIESEVIHSIMIQKMRSLLCVLSAEERWLVDKLYYREISQSDLGKKSGMSQQTISYRHKVILGKLKKMLEI